MPVTPYTREEIEKLYQDALKRTRIFYTIPTKERLHEPVDELMRCRPQAYYDEIKKEAKEENVPVVERAYFRDNRNGHEKSVVHDGLEGLYFHNATTSKVSYYGDCRMKIKPQHMLNPEIFNWYFADFYCIAGREVTHHRHKITLVVARKDSDNDEKVAKSSVRLAYDDMNVC